MGRKRKSELMEENCVNDRPRNAANERERERMRVLSRAFSKLKTTLPWVPPDTKLSKLDTLRLATCYIGHLRQILAEDDGEESPLPLPEAEIQPTSNANNVHPINLTWPYSFSGRATSQNDSPPSFLSCSSGVADEMDVRQLLRHGDTLHSSGNS